MSFFLSKFLWAFASPGNVLVFLLAVSFGLTRVRSEAYAKFGRRLCGFVTLSFLLLTLLPIGEWALTPLENRFSFDPPAKIDGIIIIGGDEQTYISLQRGMPTALDSMRRYVTFTNLARRYPDAALVFSGGSGLLGRTQKMHDFEVAKDVLASIGTPVGRMVFETNSRNTWENAVYSRDIVHPEKSQNWLLVTSAWHMTRAMGCFRKAGWNIYPAPTGYFTPGDYHMHWLFSFDTQMHYLTLAMHEYLGLAAYWLMGRTDALWPG